MCPAAAGKNFRLDERLRMVAADRERLTARVAAARPADYADFRHLGTDLLLLGRYEEALDQLDRALELADTERRRAAVLINLGDVYRYRGDVPTAESLYRHALALARGDVPEVQSFALQHLGTALAEQGRLIEARTLLGEALALRSAESDTELIESTRATLNALDRLPIEWPEAVSALFGDAPRYSDEHEGLSGGVTFVNGTYWVKRGPGAVAEHARMNWLRNRGIRLPGLVLFDEDVLVLADAAVPSLAARADNGTRVTDTACATVGAIMGALLRRLHSIPIAECPFDGGLDVMLAQARRRVIEGLVDPADFDDDHRGLDPGQVLARLLSERQDEADLVVAHGDFTPANMLEGGILIDVGGLGVADRYRDLALAARDLSDDFGADEVRTFFTAYGLDKPDQRRLDYYRLLDELF